MFVLTEQPEKFDHLAAEGKKLAAQITSTLKADKEDLLLPAGALFTAGQDDGSDSGAAYIIKNGVAFLNYEKRRLFGYEEGELFLVHQPLLSACLQYDAELAIVVDRYLFKDICQRAADDNDFRGNWLAYLQLERQLIALLLAAAIKDIPPLEPCLRYVEADEVIMEQGQRDCCVYTMVEGSADVFVDQVKVGVIERDQIFGAFSSLTNTPRSATVVATSRCLVSKVPEESFLQLISARPYAALQLLKEMAGIITDLNSKVVSLTG